MNKILLLSNQHKKQRSKRVDSTNDYMHLLGLGQLYISLQVRKGIADSLFEVENTNASLSLSKHCNLLRSGQKSDLVPCLETGSLSDFEEANLMVPVWLIH